MGSPIKTDETMDLAQALRDDTSSTNFCPSDDELSSENFQERLMDLDPRFRALVCTKESSTEIIPTQLVDSSGTKESKFVRDLNAGKDIVDDDGRPVVGKVFSRVIRTSTENSKSSKSRRNSNASAHKHRNDSQQPESSLSSKVNNTHRLNNNCNHICPSCGRQFSDEGIKHHVAYCSNYSSVE